MTKGQLINTLKDSDGLAGANPTIDDDTLYVWVAIYSICRGQLSSHRIPSVLLSLEAFRAIYEYAHDLIFQLERKHRYGKIPSIQAVCWRLLAQYQWCGVWRHHRFIYDRLEDAHHFPADADVEQYGLDLAGELVQVEIKEVQ